MNTQPVYQNNEHARLLAQDPNQEQKQSQQNTTNSISMKKVIYGLGVVALACSGSFVAGRSAAEYKLSSASSQVMLGSKPRLGASKTNGSESSNGAIVEKAAGKKSSKKMKAKSESKEVEENDEPTDVDELTPEEMKEEIKQLRGYMQTLVGDEVRDFLCLWILLFFVIVGASVGAQSSRLLFAPVARSLASSRMYVLTPSNH